MRNSLLVVAGFVAACYGPINLPAQNAVNATSQLVDIARFRQSHPLFSFLETSKEADAGTMFRNGQVPNYGGPLQYYWNAERTYPLRDVITPFGGRVVMPVARGRVELLGSLGGVFVPTSTAYARQNAWFTQTSLGARLALDPGHHFWLGGTARYLADFADKTRQRGLLSADFTFQSGR